ncbi:AraC family transcriptional regulator [Maribacter spongiicola]|uniref:AraC family transcriptional regulator n=1 Tax=Maribacter spongiicola TaxID=1206753 RepID=A0A4R7K9C1_9FLAO|nr:GyrI-like domain-containing protein [Maribacter spongiicola]TDT47559.1 AraC family transcriptional regulator [Maribacter spongiicola]
MTPKIVTLEEKNLVGFSTEMSLMDNKTPELWKSFRQRSKEVLYRSSDDFISLQEYPEDYFQEFSPVKKYVKWACVEVKDFDSVPEGMNNLVLKGGLYAVFNYKGTAKDVQVFFQYIYGKWISNSDYNLDDRPHFEVLGDKYKNNDPNSEEEVWIPIKAK